MEQHNHISANGRCQSRRAVFEKYGRKVQDDLLRYFLTKNKPGRPILENFPRLGFFLRPSCEMTGRMYAIRYFSLVVCEIRDGNTNRKKRPIFK